MYILGIYNAHNATAAILKDGKVIATASEERFTKKKNQYGFPKHSIDYCLKTAGITGRELDLVVIPFKYGAPQHSLREEKKDLSLNLALALYKSLAYVRKWWGELAYRYPELMPMGKFAFRAASIVFEKVHMGSERQFVADYLHLPLRKVITVDHHEAHAVSGYYCSSFYEENTLVLTLDGEGDFNCASVSLFEKGKHKILATTDREHSLGYVYQRLTQCLGMKANEHEYKVMGLAPYAKGEEIDRVYNKIKDIVYLDPENPLAFKSKFNLLDSDKFIERTLYRTRFDILAAAFQKLMEERATEWVLAAVKKTKTNRLVLSGGVFMNIKVNQKISELSAVRELFVMPSCGDESTPIGAAQLGFIRLGKEELLRNSELTDLYLGPAFTNSDVEKIISKRRLAAKYKVIKLKNVEKEIAVLLSKGEVVARMAGRMEFGARALGNRSILANPTTPGVVRKINDQIKGRDFWMPFAPVVVWERMNDYLVNPKKLYSPFMMVGFETTDLAHKELAASLHQYDLTARPQLLKEEVNPKYFKIIKEFEKITGIGGLLNTSFNLHGFPIVLGPEEAVDTFENSGLQHLVVEDYLISKKQKSKNG